MRYLTLGEVLRLHEALIASSGGAAGLRDLGRLQSALAQPLASYGDEDLYPTVIAKAGALGFSLIQGHPFIDGNKRIGHASMEVFLALNGFTRRDLNPHTLRYRKLGTEPLSLSEVRCSWRRFEH